MQALGLIETRGLVAAVESADAMLKTADVTLIDRTYTGGGLVSIAVTGEVAAVQAAVEAGAAAVGHMNRTLLVSQHVIPRPHEEVEGIIFSVNNNESAVSITIEQELEAPVEEPTVEGKNKISLELESEELHKNKIDDFILENGIDQGIELLSKLRVTKLRHLTREYKGLGIAGRLISKADKKTLLSELNEYYHNTHKINN
jgi:microcompartment protein CcmL/EutN